MIEWLIRGDALTLRRYRIFKKNRLATTAALLLGVAVFFSFTGEFWANNKPLIMTHGGSVYFPVLFSYHPTEFGQEDRMVTDYRALKEAGTSWSLWPLVEWDAFESNKSVDSYPSKPTADNWFGTDESGRDVFVRLLFGFRYSIAFAILVWFITITLGVVFGGIMGYTGGWIDLIGQRLVEIWNTVPVLFLLIILVSIFKPTLILLVVLTSLFGWMSMSSYIRGEFLKNRKMDYVESARASGASNARIIFKYILPNSLVPIITFTPFIISGNIYSLTALDYLGFGLSPPTPSWGELLNQAQKFFTTAWWLAVFPSLALFLTLTLLNLIGQGVRSAFDPRTRV